jgi:hypothetical protein
MKCVQHDFSKTLYCLHLFQDTVRSESHCAPRQWYVDLVVRIVVAIEVCFVLLYSVVKQWLKCNTGKTSNSLIQFLLTMALSIEEHVL